MYVVISKLNKLLIPLHFLRINHIPYTLNEAGRPVCTENITRSDKRLVEYARNFPASTLSVQYIPKHTKYRIIMCEGKEKIEILNPNDWEEAT